MGRIGSPRRIRPSVAMNRMSRVQGIAIVFLFVGKERLVVLVSFLDLDVVVICLSDL